MLTSAAGSREVPLLLTSVQLHFRSRYDPSQLVHFVQGLSMHIHVIAFSPPRVKIGFIK